MARVPDEIVAMLLPLLLACLSARAQQSRPATQAAADSSLDLPDMPLLLEDWRVAGAPPPVAGSQRLFRFGAMPYFDYIDYHNSSVKKQAYASGVYGFAGLGPNHLVEGEVDYINRADGDFPDLHQWDYTLVYSNFSIPNWKFRVGGHYIDTSDAPSRGGKVAIAGAEYYVAGKWDAGLDAYYSRYNDFNPRMEVYQFSPHLGFEFLRGGDHHFRNDLKVHWIDLGEDVGVGGRRLFSVDDRLAFMWKQWTFGASGWIGRQTFAVRNDGFSVYNLAEEHKGGCGLDAGYALGEHAAMTVRATREFFSEPGVRGDSWSTSIIAILSVSF
ncbi:MAG: hypothetical protein ABSH20_05120 [Tepidisphaeraceae bacterium]|jgi:hypothetical protein